METTRTQDIYTTTRFFHVCNILSHKHTFMQTVILPQATYPEETPDYKRPVRAYQRCVTDCIPAKPKTYRYLLRVTLKQSMSPGDPSGSSVLCLAPSSLTVILKNPSTANATRSDPTVGKIEAWAWRNGYNEVAYLNLFAFRSPHPRTLNTLSYAAAVGPENDVTLLAAMRAAHDRSSILVAGWGNPNGIALPRYKQRIREVLALAEETQSASLYCVGNLTKLGFPRHGLHWNRDSILNGGYEYCNVHSASVERSKV